MVRQFDSTRAFKCVDGNDVAIDNASNVAANGLIIMNSGYGLFGIGSGDVMPAFRSKKQRTMCESNNHTLV